MQISDFQDAVVTVMGLGRFKQGSGVGATKWLIRHGAQVIITDLKSEEELQESVHEVMRWYDVYTKEIEGREIYRPVFVLGEHKEENFKDVAAILQNPDVPRESKYVQTARRHGIPIFTDTSLFFMHCPFPITAVTGSKGKSTTTTLIGSIYQALDERAVIAGNIKVSPLEYLDEILEDELARPIVLELSSFALESLEDATRGPEIAVFTNIYPDHLNRYSDFEAYKASKELIFKTQKPHDRAFLNYDQEDLREMRDRVPGHLHWFSKNPLPDGEFGVFVADGTIIFRDEDGEKTIMSVSDIQLPGEHNLENILASIGAAISYGVDAELIKRVVSVFEGVADRQEILGEANGVTYVNDTTATNPDAAMAALKRFGEEKKIILLGGGASKGLPIETFAEKIKETCKFAILFAGEASNNIAVLLGNTPHAIANSMDEAMQLVDTHAVDGDVVLLSPGAASFGVFKNEFDRGDQFKAAVSSRLS